MGRVSNRKIDPEIESRIHEIFYDYVAQIRTKKELQEFFSDLLSAVEHTTVLKRLAIAFMLHRGFNFEQISETLKVSKSTVNSVQRQLMSGATGYKQAIKYIHKQKNKDQFAILLESLFLKMSLPKSYGSLQWKAKSDTGKKLNKRKRQLSSL